MWLFNSKKNKPLLGEASLPEVDVKTDTEPESYLCATANIVLESPYGEGGTETRHGTKHFRGGAKVYVIDAYGGMCESAIVIGHHRGSGRYINLTMSVKYLENFRVTSIYSPKVIRLIKKHYSNKGLPFSSFSDRAQNLCGSVNMWAEAERKSTKKDERSSDNPISPKLHIPKS